MIHFELLIPSNRSNSKILNNSANKLLFIKTKLFYSCLFFSICNCRSSERYQKTRWQDIRVGDIVHLSNNETIPADMLLLRTSNPHGVCYIDTCDLDGETNLKLREVVRGFIDKQQLFTPSKFTSRVEVDIPTTKIFKFNGALIHPAGARVPVSTENLLLRESRLKVNADEN